MLEIFRSNSLFSILGLLLFTVLIRLSIFFIPLPLEPALHAPFAELIFDWLEEHKLFAFQLPVLATL
ncbi:MAG: hypothetical protein ACOVK9_05265, partial [Bacteroidia bacterium]